MDDLQLSNRVDALARVEPASLPLLSVYLNTDVNETGRTTHDTFLRKELRQRAKTYPERSADRDLIGDYRAGGLTLVGPERARQALERGQVDTLVIAAEAGQVPGADDAANELVTLAKQTSATVRFIENPQLLADVGGVGASLRFAL